MGCTYSSEYPNVCQKDVDAMKEKMVLQGKNSPTSLTDKGTNYNIGLINVSEDEDVESNVTNVNESVLSWTDIVEIVSAILLFLVIM